MARVGVGVIDRDGYIRSAEIEGRKLVEIMRSKSFRHGDANELISALADSDATPQITPAPAQFGYVLVDLANSSIVDWQGYYGIKTIGSYELRLGLPVDLQHPKEIELQKDISSSIIGAYYYSEKEGVRKAIDFVGPLNEKAYQAMVMEIENAERSKPETNPLIRWLADRVNDIKGGTKTPRPTQVIRFELDFPAWKYSNLEGATNESGCLAIRDELDKRGLLDDKGRRIWTEMCDRESELEALRSNDPQPAF